MPDIEWENQSCHCAEIVLVAPEARQNPPWQLLMKDGVLSGREND